MTLPVLHLDNHLLVVNKPAGMLAQADITGDDDVVSLGKAFLKERFDKPGNVFLGLVHRLDRPTSGVMVLARTSKSAARLSDQFRRRMPGKHYIAMVEGTLRDVEGRFEDHLVKQGRHVHVVDASAAGARFAALTYRVIGGDEWKGKRVSLVDVRLETGWAHQIRVQFASRGMPLVGDMRYGAETEFDGRNLALHACALTIEHPTRREEMTFKAPPTDDWGEAFARDIARAMSRI